MPSKALMAQGRLQRNVLEPSSKKKSLFHCVKLQPWKYNKPEKGVRGVLSLLSGKKTKH